VTNPTNRELRRVTQGQRRVRHLQLAHDLTPKTLRDNLSKECYRLECARAGTAKLNLFNAAGPKDFIIQRVQTNLNTSNAR